MMSGWNLGFFNSTTPNNGRKRIQPLDSTDSLSNSGIKNK